MGHDNSSATLEVSSGLVRIRPPRLPQIRHVLLARQQHLVLHDLPRFVPVQPLVLQARHRLAGLILHRFYGLFRALRRRTVSLLDVCLRHCWLVQGERRARRESIKSEAFFILGSSAIHVGELPYLREKGLKTDTKSHPFLIVGELAFNLTSAEESLKNKGDREDMQYELVVALSE